MRFVSPQAALLLGCWPVLAALGLDDGTALLQGRVVEATPRRTPRTLMFNVINHVDDYLNKYTDGHGENSALASQMSDLLGGYQMKLESYFGMGGGAYQSKTIADLLSGAAALLDSNATTALLKMLRDEAVVEHFAMGIKNVTMAAQMLALRTERRVADLKALSSEPGVSVPELVTQLFQRQEHIAKTSLHTIGATVQQVLRSMPKGYHRYAVVVEAVLERLVERAAQLVETGQQQLAEARGLCGGLAQSRFNSNQAFPLVSHAVQMLPMFEHVAQRKVPDVAPAAKRLASELLLRSKPLLARYRKDFKLLVDTVCELAPAAPHKGAATS